MAYMDGLFSFEVSAATCAFYSRLGWQDISVQRNLAYKTLSILLERGPCPETATMLDIAHRIYWHYWHKYLPSREAIVSFCIWYLAHYGSHLTYILSLYQLGHLK